MIPVVTILALDFGTLFSGALITETMFAYLGMGKLIYDAILGNDYNLALVGLLLATLMHAGRQPAGRPRLCRLDPRISFTGDRRHLSAARGAVLQRTPRLRSLSLDVVLRRCWRAARRWRRR